MKEQNLLLLRRWAEAAHQVRGIRSFKLLQGVLALARTHTRAQMLRAAHTALVLCRETSLAIFMLLLRINLVTPLLGHPAVVHKDGPRSVCIVCVARRYVAGKHIDFSISGKYR